LLLSLLFFALGLVALYYGAEWLVGSAARLAQALGVSSFVIGLTVVSFGTSAPELVVSGLASARGNGGLAIGNVLGSNVANIALILGISALIFPIWVSRVLVVRDLPIMIGLTALIPVFGWDGVITRAEGALLLLFFGGYVLHLGLSARRERRAASVEPAYAGHRRLPRRRMRRTVGRLLIGLVLLSGGAHLLVRSAVGIAEVLQVPDVVIGLTLVALGTSLPELAASISAARRGDGQIVIGNIIGSNIFNVSLILGAASLVRPLPVAPFVVRVEAPIVLGLSLALIPVVYTGRRVDRWEGAVLFACYCGFIVWTVL
jgi:cation:H+ antiporter